MAIDQLYAKDLAFWQPTTNRPHDNDLWVSVSQAQGHARVSIPATSRAVQRSNGQAAYLRYPFYFQIPGSDTSEITQDDTGPRTAKLFDYLNHLPTSDGNPSPAPTIEEGGWLIAEGHENYASASALPPVNRPSDVVAHVGLGGQFVKGSQFSWIVPGNETPGTFSPFENINLVGLDGATVSVSEIDLGTYTRLYQSACVIESDALKDNLFLVGGLTAWDMQGVACVLVNPHTQTVTETADQHPTGAAAGAAIYLPDSEMVLVTGGYNNDMTDSKADSYLFDPLDESWTEVSALITPRRQHRVILLDSYLGTPGELVLVLGGKQGELTTDDTYSIGVPLNKCEIFNGATYSATGSMSEAKYSFGVVKLPDGRVLVAGGVGYNPSYPEPTSAIEPDLELQTAEIFDPATGLWSPLPRMLEPHSHCVCEYLANSHRVYVFGGYSSTTVEYLDLTTMTWHRSRYSLDEARTLGVSMALGDYVGLVGGGVYDADIQTIATNDDITLGSKWGWCLARVPESNRWDGLNGLWRIESLEDREGVYGTVYLSSESFGSYQNTSVSWSESTRFILAKGVTSVGGDILGPFVLDPDQPFYIGETKLELAQTIESGVRTGRITVTSGASSVGESWLVFQYGFAEQVGPVRCFGGVDDTALEIDSGFKFPRIEAGATINIVQRGELGSQPGSFWLTASNAGRTAAILALQSIHSAGIELYITTRYPGDRGLGGEGLPILHFDKLSDIVQCYSGDDVDEELAEARTTA